ncbi:hypothetical protein CDL12_26008 [Handroanthus impetiginosus]|uniref:Uncharacterized protein n=1 Tax=Handroanthus impetiginosus TaxID=429701 RepID=A0A2G9G870_9LAMI|nr:hypothetical protein CDL12_26008 [Handroanthus impetiginosus]
MDDRNPSPASSSSSAAVGKQCRRLRRHTEEEDGGDPVACTGKSCQSCTAGVIADCIAVCCCPCAVVNILALAFFKLPWAVARKCLAGRKRKSRRRVLEERRKRSWGDRDGISEKVRVEDGTSEIVLSSTGGLIGEELNDNFSAEFRAEDVWLELYEVGHLGFGRVSFTGIPFHNKGN